MRVGRFQVMSILQACRAEALGLDHDSALSWGLNRAIFFAAAKRGFRGDGGRNRSPSSVEKGKTSNETGNAYRLGDELAFVDKDMEKLFFAIGGETQTPENFRRQIASRFGDRSNFENVWKEAKKIIGTYDRETLESGRRFFDEVYKPRRDSLASEWSSNLQSAPNVKSKRIRNRT